MCVFHSPKAKAFFLKVDICKTKNDVCCLGKGTLKTQILKIYTKTGDKGSTSLLSGNRVPKNHHRLHAYGTTDELNSWVGLLREYADNETANQLIAIQDTLFALGSHLATEPGNVNFVLPSLSKNAIIELEKAIDLMNEALPELRNFVLPGGHASVSYCHIARTVCRRAERHIVALAETAEVPEFILVYINRLSDYLFVLSRYYAMQQNAMETPWKPK